MGHITVEVGLLWDCTGTYTKCLPLASVESTRWKERTSLPFHAHTWKVVEVWRIRLQHSTKQEQETTDTDKVF